MIVYLSRGQFAKRIGVSDNAMGRYKLPEADAEIAGRRGWLESTVDQWMLDRPGRGARTDLAAKDADE